MGSRYGSLVRQRDTEVIALPVPGEWVASATPFRFCTRQKFVSGRKPLAIHHRNSDQPIYSWYSSKRHGCAKRFTARYGKVYRTPILKLHPERVAAIRASGNAQNPWLCVVTDAAVYNLAPGVIAPFRN